MGYIKYFYKLILLILILSIQVFSQPKETEYNYLTGVNKLGLDTLAYQTSKKNAAETSGILEKEIEADKYLLGPGDVLSVSIIAAKTKQWDVNILPEGVAFIPEVGTVELKNKTLKEASLLIKEKISKTFKSSEVFVTLKDIRSFKVIVSGILHKPSIIT